MRNIPWFVFILALFFAAAAAQESPRIPLIYATGEARLEATPDLVVVTLGVTTQAKTVAEAREQNATRMEAVIGAVKRQGIAREKISTTGFSVSPQYDYQERRNPPKIVGYSVSNQVAVKLEEIEKLSDVLDSSLAAGANNVHGVNFTLKDPGKLRLQAYQEAVRDAQSKAVALASAAGVQLGRVYLLRESGGSVAVPRSYAVSEMAAKGGIATPIESGQITIQVNVEIQYEIRP